jgi:ATP-dependent Lon protease
MSPLIVRGGEAMLVPDRLAVLPLRDVVVFPYVVTPLLIGREGSVAAIQAAAKQDNFILLAAQKSGEVNDPAASDLHRTAVAARIVQQATLPNGTIRVLVEGLGRVRITRMVPAGRALRASVVSLPLVVAGREDTRVLSRRALTLFEEYVGLHRRLPPEIVGIVQSADTEDRQFYGVAAHMSVRHELRQKLLEAPDLGASWRLAAEMLASEIEILRLERKIEDDVRGSLFQNQREFYLQEQLKAIHRELGEDDHDDLAELETQMKEKKLPEVVQTRALRELRKLGRMAPLSPESTVSRNFLDWILALPWTERTDEVLDVEHARRVLDEDHFGLEEVKDRILDYIAVLALVGRLEGPILCLVGPPGVGKTSLGRSIARALGRKFVRMSLGGVRDEAEIRGHRRTYIGSMPGRIIQAMRRAEVINPVLLLDEVDKLGQDYRGDPAAALLEVLDPEQNRAFNDHYLEMDYDLSQVLFITTANSLTNIPDALRDRMEIIRLAGYLDHEKLAIARQYLVPRQLSQHGIDPATVTWESGALQEIMRGYTREAGVREFERRLARVARKLARRKASSVTRAAAVLPAATIAPPITMTMGPQLLLVPPAKRPRRGKRAGAGETPAPAAGGAPTPDETSPLGVRVADLKSLLGSAPYDPDETSLDDKVGVAVGLAYTAVGGETLEVEVSIVGGRGKLQLTGTLGDVMKESASAALSYARARAGALGIERDFHRTRDIHVHIPAGATPKDGPSAGIAIATAIISALTGVPIRGDVAMTGEITLRGRVLPIGGLKEKSVAAHRGGITHVIIPHGNARDLDDLAKEVTGTIRFHPVRTMDDVLAIALRPPAAEAPAARKSGSQPVADVTLPH